MERARHQLFAGSRLSQDANARLAGRHAFNLCHEARHHLSTPYQFMLAQRSAELAVLPLETREPHGIVERQQELVYGDRLLQKIDCAHLGCAHCHLHVRLPGHHDYRRGDAQRLDLLQQRYAVFPGHHDIGQNEIKGLALDQFESSRGLIADRRLVPGKAEGTRERCQSIWLVIDNEQVRLGHAYAFPMAASLVCVAGLR